MPIPYKDFLIIIRSHEVNFRQERIEHRWILETSTSHIEGTNCEKISVQDTDYERALRRIKECLDEFNAK